jgi:hypothetical protein
MRRAGARALDARRRDVASASLNWYRVKGKGLGLRVPGNTTTANHNRALVKWGKKCKKYLLCQQQM